MDKITGIVRKINVGADPKDNMSLSVGQKMHGLTIVRIVCSEYDIVHRASYSYYIYVLNKKCEMTPWKAYHNMMMSAEYYVDVNDAPNMDDLVIFHKSKLMKFEDFKRG